MNSSQKFLKDIISLHIYTFSGDEAVSQQVWPRIGLINIASLLTSENMKRYTKQQTATDIYTICLKTLAATQQNVPSSRKQKLPSDINVGQQSMCDDLTDPVGANQVVWLLYLI